MDAVVATDRALEWSGHSFHSHSSLYYDCLHSEVGTTPSFRAFSTHPFPHPYPTHRKLEPTYRFTIMTESTPSLPPLMIWQQNMNKSLTAHEDLLETEMTSLRKKNFNVIALQEPYIDHLSKTSGAEPYKSGSIRGREGKKFRGVTRKENYK